MANREGIGFSRKYAEGAIHENASGRFTIVERYLEDGIVMLKYQWLSGVKEGEIETNKEQNINASIHKYQVSRGLPPRIGYTLTENEPVKKMIEEILENTNNLINNVIVGQAYMEKFEVKLEAMQTVIQEQQAFIGALSDQISRLINHGTLLTKQQEALNKQQDSLNKLIEKI